MLTRGVGRLIGKPGQSSTPVGRLLNEHANACVGAVLERCSVATAAHPVRIRSEAVVEAFPSAFLGVMLRDPAGVHATRGDRSDTFYRHLSREGALSTLVEHLLPGRTPAMSLHDVTDHDERAAVVCGLTALCVAAGKFIAVGDEDGWIILPPVGFTQPWARSILERNAGSEQTSALYVSG